MQGYFDGLRAELSPHNITVTIVSPGYVNTSLSLNALNADGTAYNKADETTASGKLESLFILGSVLYLLQYSHCFITYILVFFLYYWFYFTLLLYLQLHKLFLNRFFGTLLSK